MRVLHVIPSISPYYGGPSKAVVELCSAMQRFDVNSTIATTNADGDSDLAVPLDREVDVQGVPVYYFPRQFIRKPVISLPLIYWLRGKRAHFDLLHIHGVFSVPATAACLWARRSGTPYVVRPCGTLSGWSLSKKQFLKSVHLALVGRGNLNGAAVLHVTSEGERQEIQQINLRPRVAVIPLGITPPTIQNGTVNKPFRHKLKRFGDKKVILFLSRIDPKKGLDLLITAVTKLLSHRHDFVLVIAGAGPQKQMEMLNQLVIKHRVGEHVVLPGFVQGAVKDDLFRSADIFVLPSYNENFGLAVLEAMSRKLPVIISDQVALYSEIRNTGAGIVTPCNADAVAHALNTLLNDESMCQRMGENGFNLVRRMYTWDSVAVQVRRLYENILSGQFQRGKT